MKYLKFLEFSGNDGHDFSYDFSPRRGTLYVLSSNNLSSFYFSEAFREVLNYLENNKLKNITPDSVLTEIIDYVKSITSDIVNSLQIGSKSNLKLPDSELCVLNNMINLPVEFWYESNSVTNLIRKFIDILYLNSSNIIYLDKNIFYYDGFKLDLKTKKWSPPKNSKVRDIKPTNINIFKNYNFQKEFLKDNAELIHKIPDELIDDKIRKEYDYILKSKKYNL